MTLPYERHTFQNHKMVPGKIVTYLLYKLRLLRSLVD